MVVIVLLLAIPASLLALTGLLAASSYAESHLLRDSMRGSTKGPPPPTP